MKNAVAAIDKATSAQYALAEMTAQRDDLLAACRAGADYLALPDGDPAIRRILVDVHLAAIAKATGAKPQR